MVDEEEREEAQYPPLIHEALAHGILVENVHRQLIAGIDTYARIAGIPPEAICTHLLESVGDDECEWVKAVIKGRKSPPTGLAYIGDWADVSDRMVGMTGALLRHFVDARVMTAADVLEGARPECKVLMIPNFLTDSTSRWTYADLADVLLHRAKNGFGSTVIGVHDFKELKAQLGLGAYSLVKTKFQVLTK